MILRFMNTFCSGRASTPDREPNITPVLSAVRHGSRTATFFSCFTIAYYIISRTCRLYRDQFAKIHILPIHVLINSQFPSCKITVTSCGSIVVTGILSPRFSKISIGLSIKRRLTLSHRLPIHVWINSHSPS